MSLSILDIERGALELERNFDERINKLTELEEKLLEDKKVQLYVFIHENLKKISNEKKEAYDEYLNHIKETCEHPLYVCVTDGYDNTYSYKCICLNCKKTRYFKQYELDKLYDEHKVIARLNGNIHENHFYSVQADFTDIRDYYKEAYAHLFYLNGKLNNAQDINSIELASAEITFNYFVYPEKEISRQKRLKK